MRTSLTRKAGGRGLARVRLSSLVLAAFVAAMVVGAGGAQAENQGWKPCPLYGNPDYAFHYIPGTDICVRMGGYIRAEAGINAYPGGIPIIGGNLLTNNAPLQSQPQDAFDVRVRYSVDLRTPTSYGPVRTFVGANINVVDGLAIAGPENSTAAWGGVDQAFVQFAGATVGAHDSYFAPNRHSYGFGYQFGDFGWERGIPVAAYTAKLGKSFSATVSLEDGNARRNAIWDPRVSGLEVGEMPGPFGWGRNYPGSCGDLYTTATSTTDRCGIGAYGDAELPDIILHAAYDYLDGKVTFSGALHQITVAAFGDAPAPGDTWGGAVDVGVKLHPSMLGKQDEVWGHATWASGAPSFTGLNQVGGLATFAGRSGDGLAAGWALDGVVSANGALQLSSSWSIGAGIEHHWNSSWLTSGFAGYASWNPGGAGNDAMCSAPTSPVRTLAGGAANWLTALPGCNFAFNTWTLGTRTMWTPVAGLEIGVQAQFSGIHTGFDPAETRLAFGGGVGLPTAGLYTPDDFHVASVIFRVQRNFSY